MARGYIYYVTTDKDQDVSFNKGNYFGKLDILGAVNYMEDQTEVQSEEPLKWLSDTLYRLGAVIGYGYSLGSFGFSFVFENVPKAQQDWFRPKLELLKKNVDALTLSDVIRSAPCLDHILDDTYNSLIALNDGGQDVNVTADDITVDDLIRRLKPGVTYYVYSKVILMH